MYGLSITYVCDGRPVYSMIEFWESSTQKPIVPELLSSSGTLTWAETPAPY
jgi:hypothetical protein